MDPSEERVVYTVGHSTHNITRLIAMLQSFGIRTLVDIRRFPGSRKFPDFNKEQLEQELQKAGINYIHLEGLGGRRQVQKNSKNDRDRKSTRLNSSHVKNSYAVFCLKKKSRTDIS